MNQYLFAAAVVFVYMNIWFMISVRKKRNDVADIAWGVGFVVVAWTLFLFSTDKGWRPLLVDLLVTLWGLRLAWHIFSRNKKKQEDFRYLAWRKQWGRWFLVRSYLQVYLLQGFFLYLISLPIVFIHTFSLQTVTIFDGLGVLIWIIGFCFETIADWQLRQFTSNPANKGTIMQRGLWRYSRHPNYFGEVMQWWGIYTIALSLPNGVITIIGPLTITLLIVFVSGVPLLEKKYAGRADYERYKKKTSIFFPLPQKSI